LLGEFASIVLTNQEPLPLLMDRVREAFGASSVTLLERRKVTTEVSETLPAVHADPGLLERIVANLIGNALRHGHGCSVVVRTAAASVDGEAQLQVSDHGPGLPADALDSLFTPFQRLGDRTARPGMGLGLAVARGFTEAMGGRIGAEPTPGGGLTMTITLPLAPAGPVPEPAIRTSEPR
jgi:two-component system sensor histidine kinase KdpD